MRQAGTSRHGLRARALIVVLWRSARIQEALALNETDLDQRRGSVTVTAGKGGRRREVGIDNWALSAIRPWLAERAQLPVGPAVLRDRRPHPRRPRLVKRCGPRRVPPRRRRSRRQATFAPHQLRHALAVELAREGVPLPILQRQLGHRNVATTSIYLSGIGTDEVIATVAARPAPMMTASAGLEL
jgi:site-specific recombinase XerD